MPAKVIKKAVCRPVFLPLLVFFLHVGWLCPPLQAYDNRPGPAALSPPLDTPISSLAMLYDEDELFISATDTARILNQAPAIASVINAKQIRDMGAKTLLQAIRTLPGIGVMYDGTFGVLDALEARGLRSESTEKILILLDGHRLNVPFTGSSFRSLSAFPLAGVERIEVIRGPGSALYGAGALLATINIIMRDGSKQKKATSVALGGGSDAAAQQHVVLQNHHGSVKLFGTYSHMETDGDPQPISQDLAGNSGVTNDWRNNHAGYVHADINNRIGFTGFVTTQTRGTPISIDGRIDTRTQLNQGQSFARFTHTAHLGNVGLTSDLSLDQYWGDMAIPINVAGVVNMFNPSLKNRTINGKVTGHGTFFRSHRLTLGTEFNHIRQYDVKHVLNNVDVSASLNHNQDAKRRVVALFIQDEWQHGQHAVLTTGLRWDHYSDFGSTVNPRVAYVWSPQSSLNIKLLYGRAFRSPSFLELYEINNPAVLGNPNLNPETMDSTEAGVDWRINPVVGVSANLFLNRFRNRIVRQPPLTINSGGVDIWGAEAEVKADWREFRYGYLNGSWTQSNDKQTDKPLANVPRQRIKAGITWGPFINRFSGHLDLRWAGKQSRPTGDTRPKIKAYTVVDLALTSLHRTERVNWTLTVHNLMDKTVFDPSQLPNDTPRPGRTWVLQASYEY